MVDLPVGSYRPIVKTWRRSWVPLQFVFAAAAGKVLVVASVSSFPEHPVNPAPVLVSALLEPEELAGPLEPAAAGTC